MAKKSNDTVVKGAKNHKIEGLFGKMAIKPSSDERTSIFPNYTEENEFLARIYLSTPIKTKDWWGEKYTDKQCQIFPGTLDNPCILSGVLSPDLFSVHGIEYLLDRARKVYYDYYKSDNEEEDLRQLLLTVRNLTREVFARDFPELKPEETTAISDTMLLLGRFLSLPITKISDIDGVETCKIFLSAIALGKIAQFCTSANANTASYYSRFDGMHRVMNHHWYADWSKKTKRKNFLGGLSALLQLSDQPIEREAEYYAADMSYLGEEIRGYNIFSPLLEAQSAIATIDRISSKLDVYNLRKENEEMIKKLQKQRSNGGIAKGKRYEPYIAKSVERYCKWQQAHPKGALRTAARIIADELNRQLSDEERNIFRNGVVGQQTVEGWLKEYEKKSLSNEKECLLSKQHLLPSKEQ